MYYVYRFLDKQKNVIYVGKSKQALERRLNRHSHLPNECYDLTHTIEYIECFTESDMSIKEIYYINKYYNEKNFFNILDISNIPASIAFSDEWKHYMGPLGENFPQSINYIEGYSKVKKQKYNKDGSINKCAPHKLKGVESFVDGLTTDDVNKMVNYFIDEINNAENKHQEQIRFRNLLMFVLGVNIPHKTSDFLNFKYKDLLDKNDYPKRIEYAMGRAHKDETIHVPLNFNVQQVLLAYIKKYGLNYADNAENALFQSRKHQIMTSKSWWNILNEAANAVGIEKNIGAESIRKTYGLNIFNLSLNKFSALLFLGELWGREREANVIKYLDLVGEDVDFEYYFGETFSIGKVDLSLINCLEP